MKWCNKGQHFVEHEGFAKFTRSSDGLQPTCRQCRRLYREQNAEQIKAKKRDYREQNRDRINAGLREWYAKCDKQAHYQRGLEWRRKYPEQYKAHMSKNYQDNKKDRVAQGRQRYMEKRGIILESQKAYYQKNKERYKLHSRQSKTRRRNAAGQFTLEQWQTKLTYFGHRCYLCRTPLTGTIHIEHRIPITRGGTNWIANIAPACVECNLRKSTKTEREYRQLLKAA